MAHIENYTERGVPFQAWLYRIAHNLVANWHRDRGRRKIIPLEEFIGPDLHFDSPDSTASVKNSAEWVFPTRTVNGSLDREPWLATSTTKLITVPHATFPATVKTNEDEASAL